MPVVIMPNNAPSNMQSGSSSGPNTHIGLAIIVFLFVNPLFGLAALICSVLARQVAEMDWNGAQTRGKMSLAFSIAGIVTTVIAIIVFIMVFYSRDS